MDLAIVPMYPDIRELYPITEPRQESIIKPHYRMGFYFGQKSLARQFVGKKKIQNQPGKKKKAHKELDRQSDAVETTWKLKS